MWLDFKDIFEIYKRNALDISLLKCWILYMFTVSLVHDSIIYIKCFWYTITPTLYREE